MQFITCHPNKGISNLATLTIADGICDGNLCTFTPGGWGADCSGNNAGCLRDRSFASVFPSGLTIGDGDGIDGDPDLAATFTTPAAVNAFLPAGGSPGLLSEDKIDPTTTGAGVFAGELVAAKLNVAFDDAGALDGCKTRLDLKLGDLTFVACVNDALIGWKVRDVIDLADLVISGSLGAGPFDITGDGVADVSVSDLSDALDRFNNDFDDGTQDLGCLGTQ
jgi:hypothetical protein